MTITALSAVTKPARNRTRVLWVACGAHALHDGFTDTLYVLLPLWQAQFALSYAAIGVLRALYAGVMAGLQVPVAGAAQRIRRRRQSSRPAPLRQQRPISSSARALASSCSR